MRKLIKVVIIVLWFCSLNIAVDSVSDILEISTPAYAIWLNVAIFLFPFTLFKIKNDKCIFKVVFKYLLFLFVLGIFFLKPLIFIISAIAIIIIICARRGDGSNNTSCESTSTDVRKEWNNKFEEKLNDDLMKRQLESRKEKLNKVEREIYKDSHKYLDNP